MTDDRCPIKLLVQSTDESIEHHCYIIAVFVKILM